MSSSFLAELYFLLQIVAILCMRSAVTTARTPQGAVGWVVFLFAAPHFAVPVFLVLGHRRYPGYVATRRALRREIASLRHQGADRAPDPEGHSGPEEGRVTAFEQLAGVPVASGNDAHLLIDGPEAFAEIFSAIEQAKAYILVQFYTIHDDQIGQDLSRRLIEKARAGVTVKVLYDALGSGRLPRKFLDGMRDNGVDIRNFHAIRHSRNRLQINFRNHRKIVIVDGITGFTGGLNLADQYMGRSPRFGHWRDTFVQLSGPVVAQLQLAFTEDWLWSSGNRLSLNWAPEPAPRNMNALVIAPGPADDRETGALYFVNAIGAARRRIWIASAYFVPDIDILTALKLAALRGVEVRILVPDMRDHWLVWLAAFAHFDEVRDAGVEIWRYSDGFMHQKVLLIDDDVASVGSVNLDTRSCGLNFEITLLAFDSAFAAEVEAMLRRDFDRSFQLAVSLADQPSFLIRNLAPLARLFAPIL